MCVQLTAQLCTNMNSVGGRNHNLYFFLITSVESVKRMRTHRRQQNRKLLANKGTVGLQRWTFQPNPTLIGNSCWPNTHMTYIHNDMLTPERLQRLIMLVMVMIASALCVCLSVFWLSLALSSQWCQSGNINTPGVYVDTGRSGWTDGWKKGRVTEEEKKPLGKSLYLCQRNIDLQYNGKLLVNQKTECSWQHITVYWAVMLYNRPLNTFDKKERLSFGLLPPLKVISINFFLTHVDWKSQGSNHWPSD